MSNKDVVAFITRTVTKLCKGVGADHKYFHSVIITLRNDMIDNLKLEQ
jgi:hypothetical protein